MTELSPETKSLVDEFKFTTLQLIIRKRGKLQCRIPTGSMVPVIPIGSEIEVHPVDRRPEKFDIVVFWNGKFLVCHYVIHVNELPSPKGERLFITRGLNDVEDWPVPESHVLGIVKKPTIPEFLKFKISIRRWLQRKKRR